MNNLNGWTDPTDHPADPHIFRVHHLVDHTAPSPDWRLTESHSWKDEGFCLTTVAFKHRWSEQVWVGTFREHSTTGQLETHTSGRWVPTTRADKAPMTYGKPLHTWSRHTDLIEVWDA